MNFSFKIFFRDMVIVAFAMVLFYLLASRKTQLLERFSLTDTEMQAKVQVESERIFTETELRKYNGQETNLLYLVILGHVYDVTVGFKHYGPGQSYHMFIGNYWYFFPE